MLFRKEALNLTNEQIVGYVIEELISEGGVDPVMISRMLNNQRDPISKERSSHNPFLIIPSYIPTLTETLLFGRAQKLF